VSRAEDGFLKCGSSGLPVERVVRATDLLLPGGADFTMRFVEGFHISSSTCIYFQAPRPTGTDLRDMTLLQILYELLQDPCFAFFNTKMRLGYVSEVSLRQVNGLQGLLVLLQSEAADSVSMEHYVSQFIHQWQHSFLKEMEGKAGMRLDEGLSLMSPPSTSLAARGEGFWKEVISGQLLFNRRQLQVQLLKTLTIGDLTSFVNVRLCPTHQKLSIPFCIGVILN